MKVPAGRCVPNPAGAFRPGQGRQLHLTRRVAIENTKRGHAVLFVQNQSKMSPPPLRQARSANTGKNLSQTNSTSSPAARSLPVAASAEKLFQNGDRPHKANGPVPVLKQAPQGK